jgi:glycosyltransferase involved in cell wall biosynthesis
MATVSVIIPTFNSAAFLSAALRSIFTQNVIPLEILVVDDCSTDHTCQIVEQLQAESPAELRLIRMDRNSGGPVGPMNAGVEAARGDWIAMLDHDDLMASRRIEAAMPLANSDPALGIVFGQSQGIDQHGQQQAARPEAYARFGNRETIFSAASAFQSLISEGFGYGGAGGMFFRKDAWRAVGGFDVNYKICWDYDFALRVTLGNWNVGYVPRVVYFHRRHSGNLEHRDGGAALYREVARLLTKLRADPRISPKQQAILNRTLAMRAIVAAQQQREIGNHQLAEQFYREAWLSGGAYVPALRGIIKNRWLAWTRKR